MPIASDIRHAVAAALAPMQPGTVKEILTTRVRKLSADLPILRIVRSDEAIELDSLSDYAHTLAMEVTYIDVLDEDTDDRIDSAVQQIIHLITHDEALDALIDEVQPASVEINDGDDESQVVQATIQFNIQYTTEV